MVSWLPFRKISVLEWKGAFHVANFFLAAFLTTCQHTGHVLSKLSYSVVFLFSVLLHCSLLGTLLIELVLFPSPWSPFSSLWNDFLSISTKAIPVNFHKRFLDPNPHCPWLFLSFYFYLSITLLKPISGTASSPLPPHLSHQSYSLCL